MDELKTLLKDIEDLKGAEATLRNERQDKEAKVRRITHTKEAAEAEA